MADNSPPEQWDDVRREQAQRSLATAHRPRNSLVGPYGRPLHPLLVTVPIGAFAATLAFDVASVLVEGRAFGRAATWLSAIGIVTGLLAAVFGFIDSRGLTPGTRAQATAVRHMILMGVTLLCFVVGFFIRRADSDQYLNGTPLAALALSVVGSAVLVVGAWIGGRLSYSDGVRVADERDQLGAHVIQVGDATGGELGPE